MRQPEALRLADSIGSAAAPYPLELKCAAELRRLHALNAELVDALETLVDFPADTFDGDEDRPFTFTVRMNHMRKCRAALSKAKEQP